MAKLEGVGEPLDQSGSGRVGFRVWIAFAMILAAIALAVWRHWG